MANIKHLRSQSIELLKLVFKELYKEYMRAYDIGSHVYTGRFNIIGNNIASFPSFL